MSGRSLSGMSDLPEGAGGAAEFSEWLSRLANCIRAAGFEVTVDPDVPTLEPRDESGMSAADIAAYNEVWESCRAAVGPPPDPEPLSRDHVSALYDKTVDTKRCLERLGYSITEPPSREAWIESYDSPGGPWLPHAQLPPMSEAEWERVNRACPQPGG